MSLSNLLTPLSILISFWLLTHLVLRLFLPHLPRVSLSYQPPPFSSSHLLLTESSLFVCFRITHLNAQADRLAVWFVRRGRRAAAQAVYALGGMLAAGGVLAAVVVLGWTAFRLAGAASARWTPHDDLAKVWKREEPEALASVSAHERPGHGIPVYAIIPGVTVPLSHLPLLVVVLVGSQVFHELGHFVTAALENVSVMSVGLSVTVIVPSAFVALSQGALRELSAPARLRIASAGAFHNLLLFLLFSALARTPLLSLPGYRDVSAWGRVVSRIQPGSPLEGHIPVGSIITKIDDELLSSVDAGHRNEAGFDAWTSLLLRPDTRTNAGERWLGWCVDRAWFQEQPTACCTYNSDSRSAVAESCFVACPPFALARCVDPLPYLGADVGAGAGSARCASVVDCGVDHTCVRPRADQALLRLTVHLPAWASLDGQPADRTVVWNGPRYEILEEVEVMTYAPRLAFLPLALPSLLAAFHSYFIALNLSLFLFNLLPLAFLDGSPVFSALFDIAVHGLSTAPGDVDAGFDGDVQMAVLERGENRGSARPDVRVRWKRTTERALHLLSAGLVCACIVLGALLAI